MQLWLIPILPLLGFTLNGLFGRRLSKPIVNVIAVGSVLLSFLWVLKTLNALGVFTSGTSLEEAYKEQSNILQFLKVHPIFDPVRGDPRFKDLVRRVNQVLQQYTAGGSSSPWMQAYRKWLQADLPGQVPPQPLYSGN